MLGNAEVGRNWHDRCWLSCLRLFVRLASEQSELVR